MKFRSVNLILYVSCTITLKLKVITPIFSLQIYLLQILQTYFLKSWNLQPMTSVISFFDDDDDDDDDDNDWVNDDINDAD